jgi:imidazole glycerol-phosphate synthase subunit HisH
MNENRRDLTKIRRGSNGAGATVNIGILDYGIGNIGSLLNMFRKLDLDAQVVSSPDELSGCSRLVLPGVGAFDQAMSELAKREMIDPLGQYIKSGNPLLGICLGMQLLVESSAEGRLPGLGYIKGSCSRLAPPAELGMRVPHMGWNCIESNRDSSLFTGLGNLKRFYFAHSYYVECQLTSNVLAWTSYAGEFASMITQDNILGVQFHPEKSHVFGMALLENWSHL